MLIELNHWISLIPKIAQENNGLVLQKIKELEARLEGLKHITSEPSAQTPGLQEVPNIFQNNPVHAVTFDSVDAGIPATPQTILGSSAEEGWAQLKGIFKSTHGKTNCCAQCACTTRHRSKGRGGRKRRRMCQA